jgi:hypothetical protein
LSALKIFKSAIQLELQNHYLLQEKKTFSDLSRMQNILNFLENYSEYSEYLQENREAINLSKAV